MKTKNEYKNLAIEVAKIADNKKGLNIKIYDTEEKTSLYYYVIILTAQSLPHIKAIQEEIEIKMKQENLYPVHREGQKNSNWKIIDYAGFIVHIFEEEKRSIYNLDKIYENSLEIIWDEKENKKVIKKVKKTITKKSVVKKVKNKTNTKKTTKRKNVIKRSGKKN